MSGTSFNYSAYVYEIKSKKQTLIPKSTFKNKCIELFAECPELIREIMLENRKFNDLEQLVIRYDTCAF